MAVLSGGCERDRVRGERPSWGTVGKRLSEKVRRQLGTQMPVGFGVQGVEGDECASWGCEWQ